MIVSLVRSPVLWLVCLALSACGTSGNRPSDDGPQVVLASVQSESVTITQPYVGRIHSHRRIQIRAPEGGVLGILPFRGGDLVKQDDTLFTISAPPKGDKTASKGRDPVQVRAPFDGLVSRMLHQEGDLVPQGEVLTTLADNSLMWVYFDVPEARYLEYQAADLEQHKDDVKVELILANGDTFNQPGKLAVVGGVFDSTTGTVPFRADFPNPERLLRHGLTGTVRVVQELKDAVVIPQEATFESGGKRYVYVIDSDNVAHRREIVVENELENRFVIKTGLHANDKIVVEGIRRVQEGESVKGADVRSGKPESKRTSIESEEGESNEPAPAAPAGRGLWA